MRFDLCPSQESVYSPHEILGKVNEIFFNQAFYVFDYLKKEMDNWVVLFWVLVNQLLFGEMEVLNQLQWVKHTALL